MFLIPRSVIGVKPLPLCSIICEYSLCRFLTCILTSGIPMKRSSKLQELSIIYALSSTAKRVLLLVILFLRTVIHHRLFRCWMKHVSMENPNPLFLIGKALIKRLLNHFCRNPDTFALRALKMIFQITSLSALTNRHKPNRSSARLNLPITLF